MKIEDRRKFRTKILRIIRESGIMHDKATASYWFTGKADKIKKNLEVEIDFGNFIYSLLNTINEFSRK